MKFDYNSETFKVTFKYFVRTRDGNKPVKITKCILSNSKGEELLEGRSLCKNADFFRFSRSEGMKRSFARALASFVPRADRKKIWDSFLAEHNILFKGHPYQRKAVNFANWCIKNCLGQDKITRLDFKKYLNSKKVIS